MPKLQNWQRIIGRDQIRNEYSKPKWVAGMAPGHISPFLGGGSMEIITVLPVALTSVVHPSAMERLLP